jgi:hypothetical protein
MIPDYPMQAPGLEIIEEDEGLVVYNPSTDRVHYFNHTAAFVFMLFNGRNTVPEMAQMLKDAFGLENAPDEEVHSIVSRALDEQLIV